MPLGKVSVTIVDTDKNTALELVNEVSKLREFDSDICWALFDKDGYTKHANAFSNARDKKVKIGFSSISFEYWLLIHLHYTTKPYLKSDDLIRNEFLNINELKDYNKENKRIYYNLKEKLNTAIKNAKKIRKHQQKCSPHNSKIYNWNQYTDLDLLVEEIKSLEER